MSQLYQSIQITGFLSLLLVLAGVVLLVSVLRSVFPKGTSPSDAVTLSSQDSIITVRKVGDTTRVDIRRADSLSDHWEDGSGVPVRLSPIETTRSQEPELFAEYMSGNTSAVRRYAIADRIYAMGLTLPFIPGLHEQWLRETRKEENVPQDLSPAPGDSAAACTKRPFRVNESLRTLEMPPMGGEHASVEQNDNTKSNE